MAHQQAPFLLRAVRLAFRRTNLYLSRWWDVERRSEARAGTDDVEQAAALLKTRELEGARDREYFEKHSRRLARTLALIPKSSSAGAILELGSYLHLTPFLQPFRGYGSVRAADFGRAGGRECKCANVAGHPFAIDVDLFNAERDRFPYDDDSFECILVCELIEHLMADPMHLILECRRVLREGGRVVLTTPNTASFTSIARVLGGGSNPQVFAKYETPRADSNAGPPHVREYTTPEVAQLFAAGGFAIETLFTESTDDGRENRPLLKMLQDYGYSTEFRGEQTYCVAVKRSRLRVTRYPGFLYS
jgi:SAM-dependent methyltransferase